MLDIIKQQRMMQVTIAILVVLNLALIASMIFNKPLRQSSPGQHQGLEAFLKTELKLSASQVEAIHDIRVQHFDNAHPMMTSLGDSMEILISEAVTSSPNSIRANELVRNISHIHMEMDMALYHHFAQINALCTIEQQILLKDLVGELMPGRSQPPPPPGGRSGEQRPPHPDGAILDRRPPPPGQGMGSGSPNPRRHPGAGGPPPRDR